jgi:hypothetical protein
VSGDRPAPDQAIWPEPWARHVLAEIQAVELAYHSLHTAKVELIDLLPDEDVEALRAGTHARLTTALDEADPAVRRSTPCRPAAAARGPG